MHVKFFIGYQAESKNETGENTFIGSPAGRNSATGEGNAFT